MGKRKYVKRGDINEGGSHRRPPRKGKPGSTTESAATAEPRRRARSLGKRGVGADSTDSLVIYVHGIGEQPEAAALKLDWDFALFGKDMGTRTRMAYWADILHKVRKEPRDSGIGTRSRQRESRIGLSLERAGVTSKDGREFAQNLASLFGEEVSDQTTRGGPGKKVLPLPGFLRRPITRAFLDAFIPDTAAYFYNKKVKEQMRARLREVLPSDESPFTLVAHSQGTIISLEVLHELEGSKKSELKVRQFVTLGSPLGITEIQDCLEKPGCVVPTSIERWNNFADPLDPVALDKGLANDFAPPDAIEDEILINLQSRNLNRFNPHSAVGYLAHPKVRRVVHKAAAFDSMSRFVTARDVAERLGVEGRHPVLIEVLEPGYGAVDESDEDMKEQEAQELAALQRARNNSHAALDLETRIDWAAARIEQLVVDKDLARVDRLKRFVAAHLTAAEIRQVAVEHKTLRVYAMWRSSVKRKLLTRSPRVLQVDAARQSYGAAGDGVTWAILDTGVQQDHPHFNGSKGSPVITAVWDCTETGPPRPIKKAEDKDGHGTHVAGIIAGEDPEGKRHGLAPNARLVVYKVLNDKGQGEDAWIIKALDHIAKHNENLATIGIHGINLSLGGPYDATVYGCGFTPICQELRRLWRTGVLVVVACGNEGQLDVSTPDGEVEINSMMSIGDPANLEDCIAVGSVNADKPHLYGISAFSSRGPTSDGRAKPDVVAPGERISSCNARFPRDSKSPYREESGTSMAAPHVSGLLAAFLSVRREFRGRPDEVKQLLLDSCTDLGRDRHHQGRGLPNLMKMLLSV